MGFHKDNPDKEYQDGPDWRSPYTIIRMGVYLQDNVRFSGGLGIRDRSHNTTDANVGRPLAAPTEVGDVVIWSLRTSHTGFVSRLRAFPHAFVPISFQSRLAMRGKTFHPEPLFRPAEYPERLALFMTFGVKDQCATSTSRACPNDTRSFRVTRSRNQPTLPLPPSAFETPLIEGAR